jgi:putative spermidine/putrescine transport system ATP-binding protein
VKLTAAEGERATVVTQGGVELSGTLRDRLSPGDDAVAAIRPEDVSVLPADRKEQGAFSGTVELAEFLGRDSELSVPAELGESVIVRTTGDWKVGSKVSLQLPPERLFVFAREG